MEIMNDASKRRTVLVVLAAVDDARSFRDFLAGDFDLVSAGGADEALEVMRERYAELSAVIIDVDMAKASDYRFLRSAAREKRFDTIPVLIASIREPDESDLQCLVEGAIDFIMPPYSRVLTKQRVINAIRVKRSATFYEIESMLRELPSNIFLKDVEGRYVFSTHYWHHLEMDEDPNWSIRGKTDLEIRKDRANAIKAHESDMQIIRTGKGMTYVIEINTDGVQEFMELIKRPVFDEEGRVCGIIALINDVTEHELLKHELEKRARTDELTGLGNRRSFDEFVQEIPRRDDFPIAVISADCDELKRINDTYGHLVGDEYIRMAAVVFKKALPDGAQAFRTGGDEFIALLPQADCGQVGQVIASMREQCKLFQVEDGDVSISYGTAMISGPDESVNEALARADHAMYRDKATHKQKDAD